MRASVADLINPPARFSRRARGAVAAGSRGPLILTSGREYPFRIRAGESMATGQVRPQSIDEYIAAFSRRSGVMQGWRRRLRPTPERRAI